MICCYLHNPWNEKQFTYTYVDRTLPSNWRGQAPAHMQSRYAASYGTYLTLNNVPLYNNLWQHTAISYHRTWQQDTVYVLRYIKRQKRRMAVRYHSSKIYVKRYKCVRTSVWCTVTSFPAATLPQSCNSKLEEVARLQPT